MNDIRNKLIPTINHGLGKSRWENALGLNDSNWITLQSFEACVHDFEEYGVSIDKNSLNDLIKDVESLIKDVDESDLNDNFKKCVIFELRKTKDTLEKYYYYGAAEVKKEIYSALVEIGMIQVKNEDEKQKEKRKNIIEFLFKLVGAGNSLLNIKEKLPPTIAQGTDFITNLLPPGN